MFTHTKRIQAEIGTNNNKNETSTIIPVSSVATKRKHEEIQQDDDSDDPFAGFEPESTDITNQITTSPTSVNQLSQDIHKQLIPTTQIKYTSALDSIGMVYTDTPIAPSAASFLTPKQPSKRVKTANAILSAQSPGASSPSLVNLFGVTPTTPVSSAAASSPDPSSTPAVAVTASSSLVQTHINDHLDEDWTHIRTMTPEQKALHFKREALKKPEVCRYCNVWLNDSMTLKDHQRTCQKLPPPVSFATVAAFESSAIKALLVPQSLATYHSSWSGSHLLCIPFAVYQRAPENSLDRKRVTRVLQWLHSVLNSDEGRIHSVGSHRSADEDSMELDSDSTVIPPESQLHPGHELWLHVVKSGGTMVVTTAVLIQSDMKDVVCEVNQERVELKRPKQSQTTVTSFFTPKHAASTPSTFPSAVASPSCASVSSHFSGGSPTGASLSPLFGVDKIAVHSNFRFGRGSSDGSTSAAPSSAPIVSLAEHVLRSILSSKLPSSLNPDESLIRVAFSEPTIAGRKLARRFTKVQTFLTYALANRQ